MRINDVIARADALRANTAPVEQKAEWISDMDGQLAEMMGLPVPVNNWPEEDRELLMPAPYSEVYVLYLVSKIDYFNQEYMLYANDREAFEKALSEALGWWRRNHRPIGYGGWRV